jgi:hypothetical protein
LAVAVSAVTLSERSESKDSFGTVPARVRLSLTIPRNKSGGIRVWSRSL